MKNIVATELSNLGFTTRITQTGVLVSLNRVITQMEVETALEQIVEGAEFTIYQVQRNMFHVVTEESN